MISKKEITHARELVYKLGFIWFHTFDDVRERMPIVIALTDDPRFVSYHQFLKSGYHDSWIISPILVNEETNFVGWMNEHIDWLLTKTTKRFTLNYDLVGFESKTDYALYKLVHG